MADLTSCQNRLLRGLFRVKLKRSLEACRVGDTDANHSGKQPIDLVSQRLARREQRGFHLAWRIDERAHPASDPVLDPEICRVRKSSHPTGRRREEEREMGWSRRDFKQVQGDDSDEMRGAFDRASFKGRQERRQPLDQRWRQVSLGRLRPTVVVQEQRRDRGPQMHLHPRRPLPDHPVPAVAGANPLGKARADANRARRVQPMIVEVDDVDRSLEARERIEERFIGKRCQRLQRAAIDCGIVGSREVAREQSEVHIVPFMRLVRQIFG